MWCNLGHRCEKGTTPTTSSRCECRAACTVGSGTDSIMSTLYHPHHLGDLEAF